MSDRTIEMLSGPTYRSAYSDPEVWTEARSSGAAFISDQEPWPPERREITFAVAASTMSTPWFQPVVDQVMHLLSLRPNWNGYGEAPIHHASGKRLVSILDRARYVGPPPAVVPLSDGGLQAEWHNGSMSLEIEVPPTGDAVAWFSSDDSDEEWTITQADGLKRLAGKVGELLG